MLKTLLCFHIESVCSEHGVIESMCSGLRCLLCSIGSVHSEYRVCVFRPLMRSAYSAFVCVSRLCRSVSLCAQVSNVCSEYGVCVCFRSVSLCVGSLLLCAESTEYVCARCLSIGISVCSDL